MKSTNDDIPKGYRKVRIGETLLATDMCYYDGKWNATTSPNWELSAYMEKVNGKYIRRE